MARSPSLSPGGILATLAGALVLCFGWSLASATPHAAAARALNTGVSNVYFNEAPAFRDVRRTGSTLALLPLRWNQIAPAKEPAVWNPEDPADPSYDWEYFDAWVRNAVAAGLTPVLQVRGAPLWAQRCTPTGEAICDPDPAALAAFTRAAVRRYGGGFGNLPRVRYWQALNEPNLSLFFEPQYEGEKLVSPYLYRILLNTFTQAVRSVSPSNIVLAAGLGPIAVKGYTIGPMLFLKRMLCMGGTNKKPRALPGGCETSSADIFDIHPYTTGGPTHKGGPNDVEMGDLGKLQKLLGAASRAGRIDGRYKIAPLWATEFGWDSKPPDPGGLPMRIEKQWVPEALHEAWLAGVETFMWYSLADFPPEPNVSFAATLQTGLYFYSANVANEKPKPFMNAYRFPFVAVRKGAGLDYWGRTPDGRRGRLVLQAKVGGRWRKVAVAHADSVGIFKGRFATAYGRNRKGAVRAVVGRDRSLPFPMRRVGDFEHSPFG
jgi:hypothetical protein